MSMTPNLGIHSRLAEAVRDALGPTPHLRCNVCGYEFPAFDSELYFAKGWPVHHGETMELVKDPTRGSSGNE